MNSNLLDPANIVGVCLEAVVDLHKRYGNARLGLILCLAFFTGTAHTTEQLADMLGVSPETVRRWLKPLINIGRVEVFRDGRNVFYKAKQEWAIKTRDDLMELRAKINRNLQGSNDNNLGSLITIRRMMTRSERV